MSKLSRSIKRQSKARRNKEALQQLYLQAAATPAGNAVKDVVSKRRTIKFALTGEL